jgi:hypothetical protein
VTRRLLAVAALLLGAMAPFAGSPAPSKKDQVTALELASWIRDRKPGLHIVDYRPAPAFENDHIPGAVNRPSSRDTIEVQVDGRVYALYGGMTSWIADVMNPVSQTPLTRYFGSTPRRGAPVRRRGC